MVNLAYITSDERLAEFFLKTAVTTGWEWCKRFNSPEDLLQHAWKEQPAVIFLEYSRSLKNKTEKDLNDLFRHSNFYFLEHVPEENRDELYYALAEDFIEDLLRTESTELPN